MNKRTWIGIGAVVLFLSCCYLVRVCELYRNGMGEKGAINLASAIIESHKEGNSLKSFLVKTSHFYSDNRGNSYEITVEGTHLEILYKPKSSWVLNFWGRDHQELKISWVRGEEMKIQSSIKKP